MDKEWKSGQSNMVMLKHEISFIHSFSIYSHKKAINVYMLKCSEGVPQRCANETDAPKNARQTRGRIPMHEYDFNGTASQLNQNHTPTRLNSPELSDYSNKIPFVGLIRNALQQI